jgi:hypothetical protein
MYFLQVDTKRMLVTMVAIVKIQPIRIRKRKDARNSVASIEQADTNLVILRSRAKFLSWLFSPSQFLLA